MHGPNGLFEQTSIAHAVLVLSLVISLGLAIGNIRVKGVSLGVGGVMFAGLAFGHFHFGISNEIQLFLREFGLILFVYAIGLQVGPGFFSSLKQQGLVMNLLSLAIIGLGTGLALLLGWIFKLELPVSVGLLTGAVTNTPSLGAAQQVYRDIPGQMAAADLVGLAYAVAYPLGIFGVIFTILLIRRVFRIDVQKEAEEFERFQTRTRIPILAKNFEVTHPNLVGLTIDQLRELVPGGVVISRIYRNEKQTVATPECKIEAGDVLHVVGGEERLHQFQLIAGRESQVEVPQLPSQIHTRRVIVTKKAIVGRKIEELDLENRYGVLVTRIIRSGIEFTPTVSLKIAFGDRLVLVGEELATEQSAREVGDSLKDLDRPDIVPIFVGIALGVLVGSIPISIPELPTPVKLGLAGGPLIVAIILSRFGRVGPILTYMPNAAKSLLRDFGIALFLACVGIKSGEHIFELLGTSQGLVWISIAAAITVIPLLVVGLIARAWLKLNFVSICGLLAGAMTDPPALAYSTQIVGNDAPSISYATVYPLTMFLRVLVAQIVVLLFLT